MKTIGRVIMLVGIIAALVITGFGVVDMYKAAAADREVAYEKAYVKQQKKEYKAAKKANDDAEKAGEELPYPNLPATQEEWEVVELPVVKLSFDDHIGPFITGFVSWAILVLAGSIFIGWCIGSIPAWIAGMKAAGPVRVIAGAIFWAGVVIAVCFVGAGLLRILKINKSTLPEVGKILFEEYAVYGVIAIGSGFAIRWFILNLVDTQRKAFDRTGSKLRFVARCLFCLTLIAFAALVIAGLCTLCYSKWAVGIGVLVGAVAVLVGGWVGSLALEALGTCTLIMEPQVRAAEEREHDMRNAVIWVCPVCGQENARSIGECVKCGETKPVREA
ncbi:MAG: hypothetical protein IKK57_11390 [Clostridia bacterium]|nr:hypothetical protein [Clostridia bacterium]